MSGEAHPPRGGPFRIQWGFSAGLTLLFLAGLALPGIVFFTRPSDYTVLHTVLEFTSMAISLMIVALAWNLRHLEVNSQIMVIGWASFGVLIVDLAHTLSFPGMPEFGTPSSAQKAITFWLAGRIIAVVGFLVLAILPSRHWPSRLWLPGLLVVAAGTLTAVWIGIYNTAWVPTFFVPGEGLTATKRGLEYGLSIAYAVGAVLLWLRARRERSQELAWLAAAAWTLTLAELYFTLYVNVADVFNLLGHVLKVAAYAMVYRAVFVAGVQDPYRRLTRETSLLRSLIDSVPDLISYTGPDGTLLGANRAFAQRAQVEPSDVIGVHPQDLHWEKLRNRHESATTDVTVRFEEEVRQGGVVEYFDTVQTPYATSEGERLGVIEISRDITAQRAAEERIHHLALYDQLTGLPNRVMLADHAAELFRDTGLSGRTQALVFLDLDDFKTINDTVGHRVGDLIIEETARRLAEAAGPGVQVARLGGDEFAALASPATLEDATELVTRLVAALDAPYRIEQYELAMTASAGVAMFPTDGVTFDDLASRADSAMYRAKEEGRHTYRFFSGDMLLNAAERLELLAALRRAVEAGEGLLVHYQPQVDLADHRIVGAEALVRWDHPTLGRLGPDRFIGLAEDSGLIVPLGEFVLNRAIEDAAAWDAAGAESISVSVNLSAVQFLQTDLADRIRRALIRHAFPPGRLELEITESVAMANPEVAVATIKRLHEMGVRISIDDFGTGYSSLAYLKRFRLDEVKIDKSFVQDLGHDPDDDAIVSAVIRIATSLRCVSLAEGVETAQQEEFLRGQGCARAQGFRFHRPMPSEEVLALLQCERQPVRETT